MLYCFFVPFLSLCLYYASMFLYILLCLCPLCVALYVYLRPISVSLFLCLFLVCESLFVCLSRNACAYAVPFYSYVYLANLSLYLNFWVSVPTYGPVYHYLDYLYFNWLRFRPYCVPVLVEHFFSRAQAHLSNGSCVFVFDTCDSFGQYLYICAFAS